MNTPTEKPITDRSSANSSPPKSIAIVGLGLLGGSVAMALRERAPSVSIIGCARREETRQFALSNNVVDEATADLSSAVAKVDLVVVATPVDNIAQTVIEVAAANPTAVITDVGSTKSSIVDAVRSSLAAPRFAAAHPIAGSEKTGVENAFARLFVNRPVVITPSCEEDDGVVDRVAEFWRQLGAAVTHMSPEEHDSLLATSSHMPHLMASLIAGQLPHHAESIVGTGWLDTTRIAAGDPKLWTAIVAENRTAIVGALRSLGEQLSGLIDRIENEDDASVEAVLQAAQTIRIDAEPKQISLQSKR